MWSGESQAAFNWPPSYFHVYLVWQKKNSLSVFRNEIVQNVVGVYSVISTAVSGSFI
jgi:hypothetical protein